MLFLGTEKYPNPDEFQKFISQNGGSNNAYTSTEHTNYFFTVNSKSFDEALDRFAQFFISPLFNESIMEKEINAVNQEHEKNLKSDGWRIRQLDQYSAKQNHPYSKFGTGNKKTLETLPKENNINLKEELHKFHSTYYSANIMTLSVISKGINKVI